jgi:hypothetical protein
MTNASAFSGSMIAAHKTSGKPACRTVLLNEAAVE